METQWRTTKEAYTSSLASFGSLLEESRMLLETYARLGDAQATCKALTDEALFQRSRVTRERITGTLRGRFFRWNPPAWVLADLLAFVRSSGSEAFRLVTILHMARQDSLLYDFVQSVVVPRWHRGERYLIRSDVQGFLDRSEEEHPEIKKWSYATREKLASNVLAVLRDGMVLRDEGEKRITAPLVPEAVAFHLLRLLEAEGIAREHIPQHPDWHLWLWDADQVQNTMRQFYSRTPTN